ncbi:MAG: YggS family pyridoxal phosphate-dependent enzyme [Chlamydiales bacterium]|nr:YggS family pyridoxal phosphate-dependent enzyme [Chlamydiales bacterium]
MNISEIKKRARLVVVSKGRSIEEIQRLYDAGERDFGENRLPEAFEKMEALPKDIRWHFIGKIQSKKVSRVVGRFYLIHSVDTPDLVEKIAAKGQNDAILLQVNASGEGSKSGLSPSQWEEHLERLLALSGVELKGLMTMAPFTEDEECIRSCFASVHALAQKWKLPELSMGMSNDYEIALEEGATIVRIGTKLFEDK